ncbi:hypothetical protein [Variovorax sp. KK3]|uniref:hypothetical protein n=1 Tax=Variovorax sp. KK3 TaxID=1855728 RepID=UPI00097C923B|nr:hypothetical protein [Variovorax sp. KK3]
MGLILLEALGAGILLVLIVWWTMFSGRKRGELHDHPDDPADDRVHRAHQGGAGQKAPPSDEPPAGR